MPIEMPKGLPFSVDTWTPSSKRKRHHFLTHAHRDHAQEIASHASYPIFSTLLTKALLLRYFPQLDELMFVGVEVGQSLIVEDPDGDFTVSVFDANHCPGAVMFLFEGHFGNILHTGDCRLTPECLQSLPEKYVGKIGKDPRCPLDYVFLDCTFGQFPLNMPSKHTAIQQIINCIWKHPDAPTVYLTCDLLGQEEILVAVSQTFGVKIYVDKGKNLEYFEALDIMVPGIISDDPSSRFQLFSGFPRLYERAEAKIAEARADFQLEPLIIRPSAQWYACDDGFSGTAKRRKERFDQAVRDSFGVWHVCYSMHSSRDELERALQLLAPKWVISTTPSCRAMELDYVKKHCFHSQRAFDASFWKLMDMNTGGPLDPDVTIKIPSCSNEESISNSCVQRQAEPVVLSPRQSKRLSLSPPNKRPMVTLFGRARLGLLDFTLQHEEKEIASTSCDSVERAPIETGDVSFQKEDIIEVKADELLETKKITEIVETKRSSTAVMECIQKQAHISPIGLSTGYNENLRRFYRSMSVPVPQPLPSLVKLMNGKRSTRKRM